MDISSYVYKVASQNGDNAIVIIKSAGMVPAKFTPHVKSELEARMGAGPQEVIVRARSAGRRVSYEWQYSADGGVTWIAMGTTTVADTWIKGLTVGVTYLFRFRTTIKRTTGDWSQTISFFVH